MPRSLFGRLVAIAALTTAAALGFAAISIGSVLERFVMHGLDQQLDTQIGLLAKAVNTDGTIDPARVVELPVFDQPGSQWSWRVEGSEGRAWSHGPAIATTTLRRHPHAAPHPPLTIDPAGATEPRAGDGRDLSGEPVHFRQSAIMTGRGMVTITAAGPRRIALQPLREAMLPLLGSLGLLGLGLAVATLLQLRLGLRPLRALRIALGDVRSGRARHIPTDQPAELVPLASELNALIDQNEAGLAHARRHVANLAHGLKTPLAALSVKLAEAGRDPDGSLAAMVAQIDNRVRHHLGRARAVAPGGSARSQAWLAPAITDLCHALERIHADRAISVANTVGADVAVAIDPQDLDEMVGNLLDNAWRHARTAITISVQQTGSMVILAIDDDGAGLTGEGLQQALVPGRRLDERGDGHGFGLPIAQELAELSGGELGLMPSPVMSGLRVSLSLPVSTNAKSI